MKNDDLFRMIRNTFFFLFFLFLLLLGRLAYVQLFQADELSAHPLNRRGGETQLEERGRILDRHGEVLAESRRQDDGSWYRYYPYGAVTAHAVGYTHPRYGQSGAELQYTNELSGHMTSDRRWEGLLKAIQHGGALGNDVRLTMDARLQEAAYEALGNRRGSVVLLDAQSGEILVMLSRPAYNPNRLDAQWSSLQNQEETPLLNRAQYGQYPPGSIFKTVTAYEALASGKATANTTFQCDGHLRIGSDYEMTEANGKAHGKLTLRQAMAESCNVAFGSLALALGRDGMRQALEHQGFFRPLGSFLEENAPRTPNFSQLTPGELAQTGIGQGDLVVTPLRMAMLAAGYSNQGLLPQPRLLSQIIARNGLPLSFVTDKVWLTLEQRAAAEEVRRMMLLTVQDGTGGAAAVSGLVVGGKTGTAENPHGKPHAWFMGFAQEGKRTVAIAVIVENGGSGGAVAAPIARQVFRAAFR